MEDECDCVNISLLSEHDREDEEKLTGLVQRDIRPPPLPALCGRGAQFSNESFDDATSSVRVGEHAVGDVVSSQTCS